MSIHKKVLAERHSYRSSLKRATFPEILIVSPDVLHDLKQDVSAPFYSNGTIHNYAGNYCLVIETEQNFYKWFYVYDLEQNAHDESIQQIYREHTASRNASQTSSEISDS